jgi:hypothetical protein
MPITLLYTKKIYAGNLKTLFLISRLEAMHPHIPMHAVEEKVI